MRRPQNAPPRFRSSAGRPLRLLPLMSEVLTRSQAIGAVVRARRLELGWSQAELAFRVGCDQARVARIEKGRSSPQVDTIERYAAKLGMSLDNVVAKSSDLLNPA